MSLSRLMFVLSFAAIGCAAATRREELGPSPEPLPEPDPDPATLPPRSRSMSFQVADDSVLRTDTVKAAAAWSAATGCNITASADGDIPVLLVTDFDPGCLEASETGNVRGCSRVTDVVTDGWIQIPERVHWSVRYHIILHEMGHHLRGPKSPSHVLGSPSAVMIEHPSLASVTLLPEDVAFILDGVRLDCSV